jgi:RimJ/RimL family protein N-acetyltransferase
MPVALDTERLLLRAWRLDDAEAALGIYGAADVARWLRPAMARVEDAATMRSILQRWIAEDEQLIPPAGRWAIELKGTARLVGGAILLPIPPNNLDLEMGWELHPQAWGRGYATEAGRAVARWAFDEGFDEIMSVVRPGNRRAAATAHRIGMEWVGETEKYYGLRLQVFRLRAGDFNHVRWHIAA